jgi:hypothetical protein
MKIRGLDGREYNWRPVGYSVLGDSTRKFSDLHVTARNLLKELFPNDRIMEEVFLPGLPTTAYADLYLPLRQIIVEVQGEQHYRFVRIFQNNRLEFLKAKGRDVNKRRWCELNNIVLVELPYNEDRDQWCRRILAAHNTTEKGDDGGEA